MESQMSDPTCQARDTDQVPVHEPWGPMVGLDPIQEYRVLAHELQECFPDAEPLQLDCMIAREMALYGGYSANVITQAMGAASLHLAGGNVGDPQAYVERTGNRSGCETRNHAAACDFCTLAGSRDGAASPRRAASHAVVRYSKTLRCCCFRVATTVIMLSTKREPSALCVPKLPLRQSTPGRIDLSAMLLVGSTPSTCTNVHKAWRRFRMFRHIPAVLGTPHRLPASNSRSTSRRSGLIYDRNVDRCSVPSRTRCHHANIWCTCTSKASPISSECPPRLRIASKSRSKCAQHS